MRRLRAGLVTPLPGGLGSPSVPTKRDCLEWLDAKRMKGGESRPDKGRGIPAPPPAEARPREQKSRRGAPRGARAPGNGARHEGYRQRLTALHPLDFSRGTRKAPLAEQERRRTRRR